MADPALTACRLWTKKSATLTAKMCRGGPVEARSVQRWRSPSPSAPVRSSRAMTVDQATYAAQCSPSFALRALKPAELAALDAYCARALDDPDAELQAHDEAAVARYEALLAERARDWWKGDR